MQAPIRTLNLDHGVALNKNSWGQVETKCKKLEIVNQLVHLFYITWDMFLGRKRQGLISFRNRQKSILKSKKGAIHVLIYRYLLTF